MTSPISMQSNDPYAKRFIYAWLAALLFYVVEYAVRSSPAVMIPQLSAAYALSPVGLGSMLGSYYYTYSIVSLLAGALMDRIGAKFVVSAGSAVLALGCLLFVFSSAAFGTTGRLLQGAGSAFAFIGAVYLATRGLSARVLATAIGITQSVAMMGASAGQFVLGPLVASGVPWQDFWISFGVMSAALAVLLVILIPKPDAGQSGQPFTLNGFLEPYAVVFSNPQSYLCGLIAGLLFTPTVIGDMTWGVSFFQSGGLDYRHAVVVISMVPLGWAFGCPLLGWLTDRIGLRKPVLIGGGIVMAAMVVQIAYLPTLLSPYVGMFLFGVASGAAMIPYSIIKEANPDRVKGCATGTLNFLNFGISALVGPLFAKLFAAHLTDAGTADHALDQFRSAGLFWLGVIGVAVALSCVVRETGSRARTNRIGGTAFAKPTQ